MQGLNINVLIKEENMILNLIDKISDQETKQATIENNLSMAKRQPKKQEVKDKTE